VCRRLLFFFSFLPLNRRLSWHLHRVSAFFSLFSPEEGKKAAGVPLPSFPPFFFWRAYRGPVPFFFFFLEEGEVLDPVSFSFPLSPPTPLHFVFITERSCDTSSFPFSLPPLHASALYFFSPFPREEEEQAATRCFPPGLVSSARVGFFSP